MSDATNHNDKMAPQAMNKLASGRGSGWYPEQAPKVKTPGDFGALLRVSDSLNGVSGVSWELTRRGRKTIATKDTKVSKREKSGQNRAYLGGVAGILEALCAHSTVTIHLGMEYIVTILNEGLEAWLKRKGKTAANKDIWQRILKLLTERELTVAAVHWGADSKLHASTSERLIDRARRAVAKEARTRKP
jgi:ribonuclease HI